MRSLSPEYLLAGEFPPDLTEDEFVDAFEYCAEIVRGYDTHPNVEMPNLNTMIARNNYSGMVSDCLTWAFDARSSYRHNSHQRYPDLVGPRVGMEIKVSTDPAKGGESHNGHEGWYLIASYAFVPHFVWTCIRAANLDRSDWNRNGSRLKENGSQRTENYTTNATGTAKLRGNLLYRDSVRVPHIPRSRVREAA